MVWSRLAIAKGMVSFMFSGENIGTRTASHNTRSRDGKVFELGHVGVGGELREESPSAPPSRRPKTGKEANHYPIHLQHKATVHLFGGVMQEVHPINSSVVTGVLDPKQQGDGPCLCAEESCAAQEGGRAIYW